MRRPKISQFTAFLVVFACLSRPEPALGAEDQPWNELRGRHFLIYYKESSEFADDVAARAEQEYRRIARQLGFARHDRFWLWDNRVRIYIHPTHSAFLKATGAPDWAAGKAEYGEKRISSFAGSAKFVDSMLVHELAHLIFRDFVGFEGEVPLWLDEGVAQWQEGVGEQAALRTCQALRSAGKLYPLTTLRKLRMSEIDLAGRTHAFYAQSVCLVQYLISTFGSDRFVKFCQQLRDGKPMEEALRFTYPSTIRSIAALEESWGKYLEESSWTTNMPAAARDSR